MHRLAEELGFENVEYNDLPTNIYSTFCKLNPSGYRSTNNDKYGYLIGPTLIKQTDDSEKAPQFYDIFAPKIYIADQSTTDKKKPYRLLIIWVEKFHFVLFVKEENFKLSMDVYTKMLDYVFSKGKTMNSKVDPIVEYNDEKPLDAEETVRLYYFNQSNLAIKQTKKYTNKVLTNEIRHWVNVIKLKFDDNELLNDLQVTSNNYWISCKRNMPRLVFVILPLSLTQSEAEKQSDDIVNQYFPYL
jgi:hypothetical protein